MKTNSYIRRETRALLKTGWFWRLIFAGLLLNLVTQGVSYLLSILFEQNKITTWSDFLVAKMQHLQMGMNYTVPSSAQAWQMTGASAFQLFVAYVFGAILAYGFAQATLDAVADRKEGLLKTTFGGFRRPLELAWLMFVMNLRVMLWSCLFVVPGLIAIYRYRLAWYLKGEHPEWGVGECLAESGRRMQGHKGQACALDCWYVMAFFFVSLAFTLSIVLSAAARNGGLLLGIAATLVGFLAMYLLLQVCCSLFVARAVFYRALPKESESCPAAPAA